jgi:hypothetical protein
MVSSADNCKAMKSSNIAEERDKQFLKPTDAIPPEPDNWDID